MKKIIFGFVALVAIVILVALYRKKTVSEAQKQVLGAKLRDKNVTDTPINTKNEGQPVEYINNPSNFNFDELYNNLMNINWN